MKTLNRQTLFGSRDLTRGLAHTSVRGGMTTMTSQGVQFALTIGSTAVLARLLTPADYGLIGMVAVVVNLAQMFKDAGLSMATVQKESISHGQISTLFWVNVLISIVLGIAILLGAPLVAWFYRKPELTAVTAALSISFVLGGLTIQHKALLQRHMRFGTLAGIQIAGQTVSIAITILLACLGWRYWALVGGTVVRAAADVLLTPLFCRWLPGRMRRGTGVRDMLMFGGHLTGFNFLNYFARNADNVIIGKFIGSEALGIYTRAYQLLMLPITMLSGPLSNVAVPALCRLNQDRNRLHRYYLHILYMLSLTASPIAGIAFLMSREIIIILLGPTWFPAGDVFRYLAIGGLLQPIYNTQSWLHLAVGRSDRVLVWGLIGTPIIVGSFIIGMIWGINGVAICYSLAIILTTVGSLAYAGRSAELSVWKMFGAVVKPLLSCVASVGVVAALSMFIGDYSPVWSIVTKGTGFVFFYATFLFLTFKGFKPMRDLVEIGRLITSRNTGKQA